MNNDTYIVIMAGGIGSRFWPLSKFTYPKQFLDILGTGKTLLQETAERFLSISPYENMLIVTNKDYVHIVKEQLPQIPEENILPEPIRKNTAPCIAYANAFIAKKNPEATVVVSPADHLIIHPDKFIDTIKTGLNFVSDNDALLTIGIHPNRPETGYGYIQINSDDKSSHTILRVKTFTEKPNAELAQFFVNSGEFYWNSGIFLWKLPSINAAFEKHLSDVYFLFNDYFSSENPNEEGLLYVYSECPNISIDYAIMEKAKNVFVCKADFGWSDLGTWGSLFENLDKDKQNNVIRGKNVYVQQSSGNFIHLPDRKIAVINGISNLIIVEHENMLLISDKGKEQDIKNIINTLKIK